MPLNSRLDSSCLSRLPRNRNAIRKEDALGGNSYTTLPFAWSPAPILILFLAAACSSDREPGTSETFTDERIAIEAEDVLKECGSLIYAAIYFTPEVSEQFDWPGIVHGQPPHAIHEYLSGEESGLLLEMLDEFPQEPLHPESNRALLARLKDWCTIYTLFLSQTDRSIEEFFADVYISGEFPGIFEPYADRSVFQSHEPAAIDRIASLSSAEIHDLSGRWAGAMANRSVDDQKYLSDKLGLVPDN